MDGGVPGPERNWKARGFRARLDTHEGDAGQFHVFHDMPAGVICLEARVGMYVHVLPGMSCSFLDALIPCPVGL